MPTVKVENIPVAEEPKANGDKMTTVVQGEPAKPLKPDVDGTRGVNVDAMREETRRLKAELRSVEAQREEARAQAKATKDLVVDSAKDAAKLARMERREARRAARDAETARIVLRRGQVGTDVRISTDEDDHGDVDVVITPGALRMPQEAAELLRRIAQKLEESGHDMIPKWGNPA